MKSEFEPQLLLPPLRALAIAVSLLTAYLVAVIIITHLLYEGRAAQAVEQADVPTGDPPRESDPGAGTLAKGLHR